MTSKPRVVIIGAGFGGLTAAREVARLPVDVTVIDRKNHHTFQPLLYQVATAGLSPGEIAAPIRWILRNRSNIEVILEEVVDFDLQRKSVITSEQSIDFDYLILASGATHAYFGHDEWATLAPGLKTIEDAAAFCWLLSSPSDRGPRVAPSPRCNSLSLALDQLASNWPELWPKSPAMP